MKDTHVVGKKMARYGRKMAFYQLLFLGVHRTCFRPQITSEAITFEPIKVQTCSASQNDRLNLSFVKDTHGNAKKMARNGGKMVIYESQILRLTLYIVL